MTADTPTSLVAALIVAISVLGSVIVFLFRYYTGRDKEYAAEREAWNHEREKWATEREKMDKMRLEMKAEYDARLIQELRTMHEDARAQEAASRRETAENIEAIARQWSIASDKLATVMDKIFVHLIERRARPKD